MQMKTEPEIYSYNSGYPPRTAYTNYNDKERNYVAKGKIRPLEPVIEFQTPHKAQILNITAHDPQTWNNVIEVWKNTAIGNYIILAHNMDAVEMYKYLETFLGESAKSTWEAYKKDKQEEFEAMVSLGNNPYNFVCKIHKMHITDLLKLGVIRKSDRTKIS